MTNAKTPRDAVGQTTVGGLKAKIGWVMYDFANTIFSMNIVTFFFSPWIINDLGVEDIFFSISYSASMLVVALTLPSLGRLADQTGGKMRGLKSFTLLCVGFTVLLSLVAFLGLGFTFTVVLALLCFAVANYFYEGSMPFYNALLGDVSTPETVGRISGIGVALGYGGAILGLLMVQPFTNLNLVPGVSERVYAYLPTAILFLIFALPTFFWVRERRFERPEQALQENFALRWKQTLRDIRKYPGVLRYFIGDLLVKDAVNTVIVFMAVYAEAVVGFEDAEKVKLFLFSTGVAIPGSILFGWLVDRIRAKPALLIAILGWICVLTAGVLFTTQDTFYVIGACLGVFLGAIWTTTRPLLNTLVPPEKMGQFYGLYAFSGKAAAVIGPLLWGLVALIGKADLPLGQATLAVVEAFGGTVSEELAATIHYRLALGAQMVTLVVGFVIFLRVPNRRRYQQSAESKISDV